jgi:hypothetical protein
MMLGGTYDPPPKELDEYTKKLIKHSRQNRKATEHDPLYNITPGGIPSGKAGQNGLPVDVT